MNERSRASASVRRGRFALAALLAAVLLAAAFLWWRYGTRDVPVGQPPLATVDASTIAQLRDDFNRAADLTRLIVLLSPT